jgi:hypothetical protein
MADDLPQSPQPFELGSQQLGALPIVDAFLARAGVTRALSRYLAAGDTRFALAPAAVIGVLVANLCVAREPLYGLGEWAGRHDPALLGLQAGQAGLLNDDRVGRALDQLFVHLAVGLGEEVVHGCLPVVLASPMLAVVWAR